MAILNDLVVKGPAKFLGSVDANLNVASAEKLTTSAGAGVNPIYFSGGKPVACTYSLNKSVPSNAVFTDNNVTNTLATTTKAYITGTTSPTTNTGTQVFDTGVYLDTTAGMLTATTFKGNLSGTASNADKLDGLHSTSFVNYKYTIGDTEMLNNANYTGAPYEGCVSDGSVMSLASHWWHIKYFRHANSDGFGCQVAFPLNNSTSLPQYRVSLGTTWQPWKVIGDGGNADTVDGLHASDFMPINGEVRKYGLIRMNGTSGIRVRHIDGNDTEFDGALYLNWSSPNAPIYMNGGNTAIHSGNIGSQSVNYATNAGNVVSLRTDNGYADIFSTSLAYGHACWNKWTFINGQSADSTAAGYVVNAPCSSAAIWYEVLTMGRTNRAFQLAIGCYTHQRHMFIRYMHDMIWSGWFKINTTAV